MATLGLIGADGIPGHGVDLAGDRPLVAVLAGKGALDEADPISGAMASKPAAGDGGDLGIGLLDLQAAPVGHLEELAQDLDRAELHQAADRLMHASDWLK